jgi:hypothetical protein
VKRTEISHRPDAVRAASLWLATCVALLGAGTVCIEGCSRESDVQASTPAELPASQLPASQQPALDPTSSHQLATQPIAAQPPAADPGASDAHSSAVASTSAGHASGPTLASRADQLNPAGATEMLEGKYEVRAVSGGRRPSAAPSPVTSEPGYEAADDPESDAVERGYRLVGRNPARLENGAESAEWLARDILGALARKDRQTLTDRRINFHEFADILWPEMPQSRPATNITAEDAWFFHVRSSVSAMDAMLAQWGGTPLEFTRLTFDADGGVTHFPNYALYRGVNIHAITGNGREVVLRYARDFIVKDGVWKVFIYKD